MFRRLVRRGLVVLALAAAGTAACGQHGGPTEPTSASSPSASAAPPPAGVRAGATISGTVVGVSSTSTVQTKGISITVSVMGSAISSAVDANGHFILNAVPAGHVDLHFVGNGVDAILGLDGVTERAMLTITVRVSGHDAHLEDGHRDDDQGQAELNGPIAAGSLAGSCASRNLSFTVGTTKVVTNASTQFRDGACESLKSGSRVEVKGTRRSDNSVLAASIEGDEEDEDENRPGEVEVKGTIAAGSIKGACSASSLSFTVGSTKVTTNASTRFQDVSCAALQAGDPVEVKGARQTDGSVLASRVERKK